MWDPDVYLAFADHRSRPFYDLLSRVGAQRARRVVDLGCGPGHLTRYLSKRWPGAVVNFLLGKVNEIQMRMAANDGDPARLAERVCDADFYSAELDLTRGRAAAAKPKLQAAVDKCPFASFERMGAAAELMRLK